MIRTQIQLTEEQEKSLKTLAHQKGVSRSELIRQAIDVWLKQQTRNNNSSKIEEALSVIGQFSSNSSDGSENHDHYLEKAFQK